MITHWLSTPANGYLGSDYGQDTKGLLQQPQSPSMADQYVSKLKQDIPLLQTLPSGAVNLYGYQTPPDKLNIMLDVAGNNFTIG